MTRTRVAMAVICLMITGCRHRVPPQPVIPPPSPVAIAGETNPKAPPLLPTETPPAAPVATVTEVPAAPAKKVKKAKPAVAAPPVEVAAAAPPPPMAIGSLSAAGESTAQSHKAVLDLISSNNRRLGGLPADVKDRQKDQIVRVRNFQMDAQKALQGGDAEGAMTLATKAKVLLDEISK